MTEDGTATLSNTFWIYVNCQVELPLSGDYGVPLPSTSRGTGTDTFLLDASRHIRFFSAESACPVTYSLFTSKITSEQYSGSLLSLAGSTVRVDTDVLTSESAYIRMELPNGQLATSGDFSVTTNCDANEVVINGDLVLVMDRGASADVSKIASQSIRSRYNIKNCVYCNTTNISSWQIFDSLGSMYQGADVFSNGGIQVDTKVPFRKSFVF